MSEIERKSLDFMKWDILKYSGRERSIKTEK